MATYPGRYASLLETIPTLLHQLDRLYIYCNQYQTDGMATLISKVAEINQGYGCKVRLIDPDFADGNLRDMGKFWLAHALRGYIFLVDDDLLYPHDYTRKHIEIIEAHQCISTIHARVVTTTPLTKYYSHTKSFHYRQQFGPVETATNAHIAGTGTAAFSTRDFRPTQCHKKTMEYYAGMADIYFALLAKKNDVKIKVVPRPRMWLRDTKAAVRTTSLYVETRADSRKVCSALNSINWNTDA